MVLWINERSNDFDTVCIPAYAKYANEKCFKLFCLLSGNLLCLFMHLVPYMTTLERFLFILCYLCFNDSPVIRFLHSGKGPIVNSGRLDFVPIISFVRPEMTRLYWLCWSDTIRANVSESNSIPPRVEIRNRCLTISHIIRVFLIVRGGHYIRVTGGGIVKEYFYRNIFTRLVYRAC